MKLYDIQFKGVGYCWWNLNKSLGCGGGKEILSLPCCWLETCLFFQFCGSFLLRQLQLSEENTVFYLSPTFPQVKSCVFLKFSSTYCQWRGFKTSLLYKKVKNNERADRVQIFNKSHRPVYAKPQLCKSIPNYLLLRWFQIYWNEMKIYLLFSQ